MEWGLLLSAFYRLKKTKYRDLTAKMWQRVDLSPGTLAPKSRAPGGKVNIYRKGTRYHRRQELPCSLCMLSCVIITQSCERVHISPILKMRHLRQ